MAEEVINAAIKIAGLEFRPSITKDMKLHGYKKDVDRSKWSYVYGSDAEEIEKLGNAPLSDEYTFTDGQVIWAVRNEQAVTVEDVLARRVRALFLDARFAIKIAPKVAEIMAKELGKDEAWQSQQVDAFSQLAQGYIL